MSRATPTSRPPPASQHAIEGVWIPVRLEFAGETAPEMVLEKTTVTFRNGAYRMHFGGEVSFAGTYTLAETEIENTLRIEGRHAARKTPITIRGIYQLAGNRLRLCLGMDGVAPQTFATTPNSQHYLGTYRRVS